MCAEMKCHVVLQILKRNVFNFRSCLIKENRQQKKANKLCIHEKGVIYFLAVKGRLKYWKNTQNTCSPVMITGLIEK